MNSRTTLYKATRKIRWGPNVSKGQIAEADFAIDKKLDHFKKNAEKRKREQPAIDEMAKIIGEKLTEEELKTIHRCIDSLGVSYQTMELNDDDNQAIQNILSLSEPNLYPHEGRRIDFELVEESRQLRASEEDEMTPTNNEKITKFIIRFDSTRTVKVERSINKIQILDAQVMEIQPSASGYGQILAGYVVSDRLPEIIFEEDPQTNDIKDIKQGDIKPSQIR